MTHLVPNAYGPPTFGPQLIDTSGQTVPNKFSPHGQMVPKDLVPLDKLNSIGTICPGRLNWLVTVCPEGPINWGPVVGDQMSGDHMRLGPNVSQPRELCY